MGNRWDRMAIFLVAASVSGCEAANTIQSFGGSRLLTETQMDQTSAGSSIVVSNANATALGLAPQTTALINTLASSGTPVSASPFIGLTTLNYAMSQTMASASNAPSTQADGSTQIGVIGGGGGAVINSTSSAIAAGSEASHAQINMQFQGLSIGRVDLAFGSAIATACCAPVVAAQTAANGEGGGFWRQLQASPISDAAGQVQSRVDISVVASALPILDAGQVSAFTGSNLSQNIAR
jgi:hypothetical protein